MKHRLKKYLAIIMVLCMSMQIFMVSGVNAEATKTTNFYNVVYFAYFADGNSNFMDDNNYTQETFKLFNDTTYEKSLKRYMNTISYGQLNVESNFPQYNGTKIIPYKLKGTKSDYTNDDFINEIINNVNTPSDIPLDGNNDGVADNIIFIIEGNSNEQSDSLWPHKSNFGGGTLNGKYLSTYNVHNTNSFYDTLSKSGVIAHEFLHSIGYPDLYRDDDGLPVGGWDIMAQATVFCQYPLTILRSKISGWLDISEVTENAHLTLNPASSDNGNRAFILKTPFSDTEYFVVEYRKQGEKYTNQLDTKIYGTGLIVYRVVEGNGYTNKLGDKDGIYVFRPNDTELRAGKGEITNSFLSAESGRTSIGSSNFNATLQDNALVYSDGTNSGITIENVGSAGDTISFDVSFADTSNLGIWDTLGGKSLIDEYVSDIAMVSISKDKVYAIYGEEDNGKYKTVLFNGTQWTNIGGNSLDDVSYNVSMIKVDDTPYILYNDTAFKPVLKKYDSDLDKWVTVKTFHNNMAQYISLTAYKEKIYVAYTETSSSGWQYKLNVAEYDTIIGTTTEIGSNICSNAVNIKMSACEDGLYVAYRDMSVSDLVEVQRFDGTTWTKLKSLEKFGNPLSIKAVSKDKVYFGFDDSGAEIYCYDGIQWKSMGEKQSSLTVTELNIDVFNSIPYIVYNAQEDNKIIGMKYENNEWSNEGMRINDRYSSGMKFEINDGVAYVAYFGSTQYPIVRYKVLGDNNSQPDIKEIKKEILGIKQVSEKSDLNNDKKIDVFDVVKAKQLKQ